MPTSATDSESTIATRATAAAAPIRRRPLERFWEDWDGPRGKRSGSQALEDARTDGAETFRSHRTLGPAKYQDAAGPEAALDPGPKLGEGLRSKVHRRVAEQDDVPGPGLDSLQQVGYAPADLGPDPLGKRPSIFLPREVTLEEQVRNAPDTRLVVDRPASVFDRIATAVGAEKIALGQSSSLGEENRERIQLGAFRASGAPGVEPGVGALPNREHLIGQPLKYVRIAKERGHAHQHHVHCTGHQSRILLEDSLGLRRSCRPEEAQAGGEPPPQRLPAVGLWVQSGLGQEPVQELARAIAEGRFLRGLAQRERYGREVHRPAATPGTWKYDFSKTVCRKHAGPPDHPVQPLLLPSYPRRRGVARQGTATDWPARTTHRPAFGGFARAHRSTRVPAGKTRYQRIAAFHPPVLPVRHDSCLLQSPEDEPEWTLRP